MTNEDSDSDKTCFVAMPITTPGEYVEKLGDPEHFMHVLAHLFVPALEDAGLRPIAPATSGAELIHAEIIRNLEQADFLLCDLSGLNPNVLFELGIRTSLDRPVILVKDDLTEGIPFDLNAINTLTYDSSLTPWSLVNERPRLAKHIRNVKDGGNTSNAMWRYFGLTKRATPSEPGENSLEAKVDLLISEISKIQPLVPAINHRLYQLPTDEAISLFESDLQRILTELGISRYRVERNKDEIQVSLDPDALAQVPDQYSDLLKGLAAARGLNLRIGTIGQPKRRTVAGRREASPEVDN